MFRVKDVLKLYLTVAVMAIVFYLTLVKTKKYERVQKVQRTERTNRVWE